MKRSIPILLTALAASLGAAEVPRFEADVLPVLYRHCFSCHSEKQPKPKGDLRLDSAQAIADGAVIVPGVPEKSELLRRVSLPHTDEDVMPPLKGGAQPLSDAERALVRAWIAAGAKLDGWVKFQHRDAPLVEQGAAISRAAVPEIARQVDALIERHHAAKGAKLNPPVSDEVFLRRVYLDVVGRIPGLEESSRFLASTDESRRARLIDALLGSEGYVSHTYNWKADQLRLNPRALAGGQPAWLYDDWVKDAIRSGLRPKRTGSGRSMIAGTLTRLNPSEFHKNGFRLPQPWTRFPIFRSTIGLTPFVARKDKDALQVARHLSQQPA